MISCSFRSTEKFTSSAAKLFKTNQPINTIKDNQIRDTMNTLSKYVTDGCLVKVVDYIIKLEEKSK